MPKREEETPETLRRDMDKLARAVVALQAEAKAQRLRPQKEFAQVNAVGTALMRLCLAINISEDVARAWHAALMDGTDPDAMDRASADLHAALAEHAEERRAAR